MGKTEDFYRERNAMKNTDADIVAVFQRLEIEAKEDREYFEKLATLGRNVEDDSVTSVPSVIRHNTRQENENA